MKRLCDTHLYKKVFVYLFWLHWVYKIDVQYNIDNYEQENKLQKYALEEVKKKDADFYAQKQSTFVD